MAQSAPAMPAPMASTPPWPGCGAAGAGTWQALSRWLVLHRLCPSGPRTRRRGPGRSSGRAAADAARVTVRCAPNPMREGPASPPTRPPSSRGSARWPVSRSASADPWRQVVDEEILVVEGMQRGRHAALAVAHGVRDGARLPVLHEAAAGWLPDGAALSHDPCLGQRAGPRRMDARRAAGSRIATARRPLNKRTRPMPDICDKVIVWRSF
jgi:hypothetical protein